MAKMTTKSERIDALLGYRTRLTEFLSLVDERLTAEQEEQDVETAPVVEKPRRSKENTNLPIKEVIARNPDLREVSGTVCERVATALSFVKHGATEAAGDEQNRANALDEGSKFAFWVGQYFGAQCTKPYWRKRGVIAAMYDTYASGSPFAATFWLRMMCNRQLDWEEQLATELFKAIDSAKDSAAQRAACNRAFAKWRMHHGV